MEDTPKQCSKCGEWKTEQTFSKHKRYGFQAWCKACAREYDAKYDAKNRARKREQDRLRRAKNRDRDRELRYGVSAERLRKLFQNQGGKCLICREELDYRKAHLDHNHTSKEVRGFLCNNCNVGIGYLGDDPRRIRRAAAYLQAYQTDHPDPHELLLNLRSIGGF